MDSWSNPYDSFNAQPRSYPDWMDTDEYMNLNAELNAAPKGRSKARLAVATHGTAEKMQIPEDFF